VTAPERSYLAVIGLPSPAREKPRLVSDLPAGTPVPG
jgi:hypothetical protein